MESDTGIQSVIIREGNTKKGSEIIYGDKHWWTMIGHCLKLAMGNGYIDEKVCIPLGLGCIRVRGSSTVTSLHGEKQKVR